METSDAKACATKPAKRRLEISIAVKLNMKDVQELMKQQDVKDIVKKHLTPTTESEKKIIGDYIQERSHTWPRIDIGFKKDNELVASTTTDDANKSENEIIPKIKPSYKITKVSVVNDTDQVGDSKVVLKGVSTDKDGKHLPTAIGNEDDKRHRRKNGTALINPADTKKQVMIDDERSDITNGDGTPAVLLNNLREDVAREDTDIEEVIQIGPKVDIAIPKDLELLPYPSTLSKTKDGEQNLERVPTYKITNHENENDKINHLMTEPKIGFDDIRKGGIDEGIYLKDDLDKELFSNPKLIRHDYAAVQITNADAIKRTQHSGDKDIYIAEDIKKNFGSVSKDSPPSINEKYPSTQEVQKDNSKLDVTMRGVKTPPPAPATTEEVIKDSVRNLERLLINKSTDTNSTKEDDDETDVNNTIRLVDEGKDKDVERRHVATSPMTPVTVTMNINHSNMAGKPHESIVTPSTNETKVAEHWRDIIKDTGDQTDKPIQNGSVNTHLNNAIGSDTVERTPCEHDLFKGLVHNGDPIITSSNKNANIDVREVFRRILPTCKITYLNENELEENHVPSTSGQMKSVNDKGNEINRDVKSNEESNPASNEDVELNSEKTLCLSEVKKYVKTYDDILTINQNEDFAKNPLDFDWENDKVEAAAPTSLK